MDGKKYNLADYTLDGLRFNIGETKHDPRFPSLCYLVALTDSPKHPISDTKSSRLILSWLFEMEGQARNAAHLKAGEEFFKRYFDSGFYPQTPCMVVNLWSPISAMLERGYEPIILNRVPKFRSVATGIWEPVLTSDVKTIEAAKSDEGLFWAIIEKVSRLAVERKMWISIIAQPGWRYDSAISSLPDWPPEEVAKAGRIIWQRTVKG